MSTSTEQRKGKRTGVTVASDLLYSADDGLEDPAQLIEAAQSPSNSVEGSGKENDTTSAAAAAAAAKKPKKTIRFSITEKVADELDTTVNSQHPVRKLVRQNARESMDASDLSSVSTAAPSVHEDDDVDEASHQSAQEQNESVHHKQQPASPGDDYPMDNDADDDNVNEDEDLVPPPPPDSPERDDDNEDDSDDDDEVMADSVQEEEKAKRRVSFPTDNEHSTQDADDNDDFPNHLDGDDDDKEGPGFDMQDDEEESMQEDEEPEDPAPETPGSVKEQRRREEKRMKKLQQKKKDAASVKSKDSRKSKKKTKKRKKDDDETESETETPAPKRGPKKKFNRFATTFSPKGVPLPRTYTKVPVSDYKNDSPDDKNLRRSRRARTTPLEFWRGEKVEYGPNNFGDEYDGVKNMSIVVGFAKADPTPYKKRMAPPPKKIQKGNNDADPAPAAAEEPFDSTRLRNKLAVNDGKVSNLWDERFHDARGISTYYYFATDFITLLSLPFQNNVYLPLFRFVFAVTEVVSYLSALKANTLPVSKIRKKSEGNVVGKAAQSFQMTTQPNPALPGYIVGNLFLPPKGIKDAESVGLCAQVFTVVKGQANSIEVAFDDPDNDSGIWEPAHADRFLLSHGDNFLVPPGNTYRLQNHSKTTECLMSWVIIRPNQNVHAEE